jgi:branched-chain amino acid transport system permease protein
MSRATIRHLGCDRPQEGSLFARALNIGLVFGVMAVYITVVGILPLINARWIVVGVVSLGHAALIAIGLGAGAAVAVRRKSAEFRSLALSSFLAGGVAGGLLALLTMAMRFLDLRPIFIALSPPVQKTLTFGLGVPTGPVVLVVASAMLAALGAALALAPASVRKPVLVGLALVTIFGVFQELIQIMMQFGPLIGDLREAMYTWEGLSPAGALAIFVVGSGGALLWTSVLGTPVHDRLTRSALVRPGYGNAARGFLFVLLLVLFPVVAGSYIGQVMLLVGLYILMGMGLNLEVGLAGLLDLGFVAFFAVGAYATALLTADSSHALASYTALPSLSYWVAMPMAVACSVVVGVLFGIPVLGIRGD